MTADPSEGTRSPAGKAPTCVCLGTRRFWLILRYSKLGGSESPSSWGKLSNFFLFVYIVKFPISLRMKLFVTLYLMDFSPSPYHPPIPAYIFDSLRTFPFSIIPVQAPPLRSSEESSQHSDLHVKNWLSEAIQWCSDPCVDLTIAY